MAFVISHIWPCLLTAFALGGLVAWLLNREFSTFVSRDTLPDFALFARRTELPALPDFTAFARRSELPDVSGLLSASVLKTLALKTELPQPLDLSPYAKKSDIPPAPDLSGYLTAAALAPLAFRTDIKPPDLSAYAKKSDIPAIPDLSGFALKKDMPHVPAPPDLSGFAKKSDIPAAPDLSSYLTAAALAPLALKADISTPNLSQYAKRSEIPGMPDLSGYARKSDIPAVPDLSGFARKSDIPQLPALPDLSRFALKGELPAAPGLSAFARVRELQTQLENRDRTISLLNESLRLEESTRAAEIARLEQLIQGLESRPIAAPPAPKPTGPDDLELVYGIGPVLAKRLHKLGVTTFAQIAQWTDSDIDAIEPQLDTIQGRIRREGWVTDSQRLHQEKHGEWLEIVSTRPADA